MKVWPLILLLILPTAAAFEQSSASAVMDIVISSDIEIIPRKVTGVIEDLQTILTFVPIEDNFQKISNFESTPVAQKQDATYVYNWAEPTGKVDFTLSATITRENRPAAPFLRIYISSLWL